MMWIVLTILVAQKVNFGVIAGASLTPDFHDLNCTFPIDAFASAAPGCPRIIGAESLMVSDASKRFILGPKVDIHLSRSFSVEVDALRRAIRSHTTWVVPPLVLPDGRVLPTPPTLSGAGAEFTWEFPVLAKYQFFAPRMNPFIEVGPSFRPAENRELYGVTAGAGVEIHLRTVNVTPALRYNHWKHNGRYFAWNANQFQFILGMDRKSSSDSVSAFGYHLSLGGIVGWGLTHGLQTRSNPFSDTIRDPRTGVVSAVQGTFFQNLNRNSPVTGIMLEFKVGQGLSAEIDGLYRPLRGKDAAVLTDGSKLDDSRFTVLTWEFPVLAKYRLSVLHTKPFLELGPSFRASGNLNGAKPSRIGVTGGAGIELNQRKFTISPALHFTRWAADPVRVGISTRRDQLEFVTGFSF